ncbi:lipoyltransferase [Verticillium alfalfae VaMs.102]|uniref:Putative lipoate-protein ligase A n=1 Tax=Verticillium alfalfae (strain VaMs.102 / ATCC MYA-4576 / FGSC 10136) TaxID=526221 RepID=C9SJN7_VERA1|nr:lipoyltransferase [Verticillium alfalfae VaMs.102]EEY19651.1 lipoyltransferase [Verticillium alfalfae VaMs.102]
MLSSTPAFTMRLISRRPLRARSLFHSSRPFSASPSPRRPSPLASAATARTQVYISRSSDPLLNLSIEHHLLQTTPSESTVLFLYTNRPSVVIGRNQNPWLELNLPLLHAYVPRPATQGRGDDGKDGHTAGVTLVRRRSGGGSVFHDAGNVNFSVICPPAAFDRDRHAEMVVRALRGLGVPGARVNCRHDIVVDVGADADAGKAGVRAPPQASSAPAPETCAANKGPEDGKATFKVSGSAYKLTRLRSLHHGTCLLSSPNLGSIGQMLRSPAEPFIKGRGVESVRSPVRNVGVGNEEFEGAVVREFGAMYGAFDVIAEVDEDAAELESVRKGMKELQRQFNLSFEARQGVLQSFVLGSTSPAGEKWSVASLTDAKIHDVNDWVERLRGGGVNSDRASAIGSWLNGLLGAGGGR